MRVRLSVGGAALGLLLWGASAAPAALEGQGPDGRWPLQPKAPGARTLAPFMEGWYANDDGTYSISFGYLNLNEDTLEVPLGVDNFIEPAQFNGMQPTTFYPGHQRGVFAVMVPADLKDQDVWWTIRKATGETARVPGRTTAHAYQLDWYPRPHGSVTPVVSFDSQADVGRGPPGIVAERLLTTSVGSPLTVSVNVRDIPVRDPEDSRFAEPLTLRVVWSKHQGPGKMEFTRHASTPVPERPRSNDDDDRDGEATPAGAETMMVPDNVSSTVRVVATFSEPGDYILRTQVDNWRSTDSSSGNQCCWTNGYVKVTVR